MGNFTQGPWKRYGLFVDAKDGSSIFTALGYGPDERPLPKEVSKANANLIAAAPDLYNALWEVVELSDRTLPPSGRTHECQRVYDLCRAALAKAEGE